MKKTIFLLFLLIALLWSVSPTRAASAVVGSGTPASCTEATFTAALAIVNGSGGGTLLFNCGNSPHTIEIYSSATITGWVTIIGQNLITLSAQGSAPFYTHPRFFEIAEAGQLHLQEIILTGGRSPAGDGWGSQGGSIVLWDDGLDFDTALTLTRVTILNSASTAWGGAIANEGGGVLIENSYVEGSAKWGGAYNGANGYEQFDQLTVSNSTSESGGGALRFWNSKQVEISNSTLSGNSTGGSGGAIENLGGQVTVRASYVEANHADSHGGGIANRYNASTATSASLLIENSAIQDNTSNADGGGVDSNQNLVVRNSSFRRNQAVRGGGISNWEGSLTLESSTIESNTASNGAGYYQVEGGALLNQVTFSENTASNNGGGLYLHEVLGASSANWVHIANSRMIGNQAQVSGGGIFANSAYFTLNNSELANHQAGAIYLWRASGQVVGSYLQISQSSIHDNSGDGIYQGQASYLGVSNSTLSQNSGWGVWAGSDSTATDLQFVTLRGNGNGQLNRTGGNAFTLAYSAVDAGGVVNANCSWAGGLPAPSVVGSYASDGSCSAYVSNQLLLGALALNGGSTPNHLPQSGSDLINRIAVSQCPARDQRGATRENQPALLCDVGAVEATNLFPRIFLPIIAK
jgi:hypothetical protein